MAASGLVRGKSFEYHQLDDRTSRMEVVMRGWHKLLHVQPSAMLNAATNAWRTWREEKRRQKDWDDDQAAEQRELERIEREETERWLSQAFENE